MHEHNTIIPLSGDITIECMVLKHLLSLAAATEIGALFVNSKKATVYRMTLEEMGHPQPLTPIQTDNTTACDFANDKLKQNLTHTIDMRF